MPHKKPMIGKPDANQSSITKFIFKNDNEPTKATDDNTTIIPHDDEEMKQVTPIPDINAIISKMHSNAGAFLEILPGKHFNNLDDYSCKNNSLLYADCSLILSPIILCHIVQH
jgi:hypothetical protein